MWCMCDVWLGRYMGVIEMWLCGVGRSGVGVGRKKWGAGETGGAVFAP